jgi:hypothetical protein
MNAGQLRAYAHAMIHTAAAWDVLGAFGALPPWWPPVSYVMAGAGIAVGCAAVLFALLTARPTSRRAPAESASEGAGRPAPVHAYSQPSPGGQLLAIGILLGAWLLRGNAEIPPDMPLVGAQVLAAALYAVFTLRRRN